MSGISHGLVGKKPLHRPMTGVTVQSLKSNNSNVCGFKVNPSTERLPSIHAPPGFLFCGRKLSHPVMVKVK